MSRTRGEKDLGGTRERVLASLSCAVLAWILLWIDGSPQVDWYAYTGIGQDTATLSHWMTSVVGSALIGALLPSSQRLPGALAVWPLAVLVAIPALVLTPLQDPNWWTGVAVPMVGLLTLLVTFRPYLKISSRPRLNRSSFLLLLTGFVVVMTALVVAFYGIAGNFATLENMYQVRAEFESRSIQGPAVVSYASAWLVNVFAPALTGLGVLWRRYVYTLVGVGSLVLHYLAVPSKLVVLLPIVAILVAVFLRNRMRLFGPAPVAIGLGALILVVTRFFREPGNDIFAILVYRTVYVPLDVGLMWITYFSQHPWGYFADAIPVQESAYGVSLPKLMAQQYGAGVGNYNANLWADGYANLGFMGVLIASTLIGLVLSFINALATTRDSRACVLILLGPSVALLNNAAFTSLLSAGIGVAVLLIFLLPGTSVSENLGEAESDEASIASSRGK